MGLLVSACAAGAASFTVDDHSDAALGDPAGTSCLSTDGGSCTLRAAVQAADNAGGESTIALPAGEYRLTIASAAEDDPGTGDLDVSGGSTSITLAGAGAGATEINANHLDRAFAVQHGASLVIAGVTVRDGAQPASGPSTLSSDAGEAGAFLNLGNLTVQESVLTDNSSANGGGVIAAGGEATSTSIIDSTVEHNTTDGAGGVIHAYGGSVTLAADTIEHNGAELAGGVLDYHGSGGTPGAIPGAAGQGRRTGGPLSISASTISENTAGEYGGALELEKAGPVSISASSLSHDAANGDGGAVYAYEGGTVTVGGSSFENDSAGGYYGGAIEAEVNDISVSGSSFRGDQGSYGGALYIRGTTSETAEPITTSTFAEDSATDSEGGAIYDEEGELQLVTSTLTDDSAADDGGGLYYGSGDGLLVLNDTFDGSQAGYAGGAIFLSSAASSGEVVLLNDTITRNTAYNGGGIYGPEYANTIENTILAGNYGGLSAGGGGDCYGAQAADNAAGADRGGNIDGDGSCFTDSTANDRTAVVPLLGELAGNGGPTETDGLLRGSPAIGDGVGSPLACPAADQRGASRSGSCDAGAFQGVLSVPSGAGAAPPSPSATVAGRPSPVTPPCRSRRSEAFRWRVGAGVHLSRILVMRGGRIYRTLPGTARRVRVSLVGLAKGPVVVRIMAVTHAGVRYQLRSTFHLCIPGRGARRARTDYLARPGVEQERPRHG
jgi:hypothetical protein